MQRVCRSPRGDDAPPRPRPRGTERDLRSLKQHQYDPIKRKTRVNRLLKLGHLGQVRKEAEQCVCLRLQPRSPKLTNGVKGAMTFCCGTELLAEPVAMLAPNEAREDSLYFFVLITRELACGRNSVGQADGLEDPSV